MGPRLGVNCLPLLYRNPTAEPTMTEARKHAILFATTLQCARKLIETIDSDKPNFTFQVEQNYFHPSSKRCLFQLLATRFICVQSLNA
jgi:hypothetical protein